MPTSTATLSDIPQLLALINGAFRGDSARRGWTHEADLLEGDLRTDEPTLRVLMNDMDAVIIKHCDGTGSVNGCVYLHKRDRGLYLGMLTVAPELQGTGIGKILLSAAEQHAREQGCQCIYMRVISVRTELIAWYERLDYRLTGATEPLEVDKKFGVPTQPLEFAIMEKDLKL